MAKKQDSRAAGVIVLLYSLQYYTEYYTHSGVGPWEEHPETKQTKNRTTNHPKDFQSHLEFKHNS